MKISEAIILAGGLGTRLRSVLPDLPKCMAPVNCKPFLSYIIHYYQQQGIQRFIFSLGYKHEVITEWLQQAYPSLNIDWVIETEPLGTGGAIQLALKKATMPDILILNGDTIFKADLAAMTAFHKSRSAACTLLLKPMQQFNRYGVVDIDADGRIQSFKEKKQYEQGLINGGVYLLNTGEFSKLYWPAVFSFEKDYLEKYYSRLTMYGCVQEGYFIDIGIPEDFERAGRELGTGDGEW